MPLFDYTARTRAGARVEGQVEAADQRGALTAIERLGHVPLSVKPVAEKARKAAKGRRFRLNRPAHMGARDVSLFTGELCDLLEAGMTLGNALNCLVGRAADTGRGPIVVALRDAIIGGATFSDALAQHPRIFSPIYVNMIRAGEASGVIPEVLKRLILHFERIQSLRQRMTSAMVYPVIVLVMGFGVGVFAITFILPKFKTIFDQMGPKGLPAMTRMLLGMSTWLTNYGVFMLIAFALIGVALNRYVATPLGRRWWDRLKLRTPLVRGIVASSIYANFARTLQSLLENGVPVLSALRITSQTVNNSVISDELDKARDRVTDGTTISGPLAAGGVFPPMLIDLLAIGEQTGDMPAALGHVAKRYEAELDHNVTIFTTALEPILIFVVAIIIGFVAISIMMAVLSITSGLHVQ
jgi:type II secretory pathway component PulF